MSNITKFVKGGGAVTPALPNVSSTRMVGVIAGDLPPILPEGQTLVSWIDQTQNFIGAHPDVVLANARDAILSTFVFAPKKAEIIQHILDAYHRLGVQLSEDGKRHLAFRKKMPDRYALNPDGIKRFAEDTKVTLVGYFTVQGPQANIILDATPGAIVEDIERAISPVMKSFSARDKDKIIGDDVLARFAEEAAVQRDYRLHGPPDVHCGGPVGSVITGYSGKPYALSMDYLAVSQAFVDRMRDTYPHAIGKLPPSDSWAAAMIEAFYAAAPKHNLKKSVYGAGMQADAEALIERRMSELNDHGRTEKNHALGLRREANNRAKRLLEGANGKVESGQSVSASVNGEWVKITSQSELEAALRKLANEAARIESESPR